MEFLGTMQTNYKSDDMRISPEVLSKCTYYKQSHTSRKNDVFIVLESETTLPLIIVVIIQNRRKLRQKKPWISFHFCFLLIYIPALYVQSGYQIKHKNLLNRIRPLKNISDRMRKTYFRHNKTKIL